MRAGNTRRTLARMISKEMADAGYTAVVDPERLIPAKGYYRSHHSVDGMPWDGNMQVSVNSTWRTWGVRSWSTMTRLCRCGFDMRIRGWDVELIVREPRR